MNEPRRSRVLSEGRKAFCVVFSSSSSSSMTSVQFFFIFPPLFSSFSLKTIRFLGIDFPPRPNLELFVVVIENDFFLSFPVLSSKKLMYLSSTVPGRPGAKSLRKCNIGNNECQLRFYPRHS